HPCETLWASATVDPDALETVDRPTLGRVLRVPMVDRLGTLAARLTARKVLERADLSGCGDARLPVAIADAVVARHVPGARTLVVLNTVGRAQAVARELAGQVRNDGPAVVLVHSRFRPPDRVARLTEALADVDPGGPGTI